MTLKSKMTPDGTGIRHDEGKDRWDLLPVNPVRWVVKVFTKGAAKYAERNWEKGMAWGKHYAAMQRHMQAFWGGEDLDPDSGLPHLAHAAFGCLALMEYMETHREGDDRPARVGEAIAYLTTDKAFPWPKVADVWPSRKNPLAECTGSSPPPETPPPLR